ncbi:MULTISPECIES: McrC family protein [unclassified Archaeoglobus]|uniref:McrC family protein n=1 Tax=unclassified Archaeoglobus TaxID=2643606 RepID=UPI0025BDFE34|nr:MULTISPECIES: hypothetical protein [unclassified Archaeoglobus]
MKVKTVTTFEYTEFEYKLIGEEEEEGCEDGTLYVRERSIELLERLNDRLKFANIGRRRIKLSNYAGVISFGDIKLEILPKFIKRSYKKKLLTPDEVKERKTILSNLLQMLKYTRRLGVKEVNWAPLGYEKDFFEIFVYIFASNLLRLLNRKRDADYVRQYDELRYVKGKIDARKYGSNPARLHLIPCTFYERSMDTRINRTLKYVSYLLSRKVENRENYKLLKQILAVLDPVSLSPVNVDYVRRITFNRLNSEFKPYIYFCELILSNSSVSLQGSEIEFFSILFPMEKLFEEFIAEVIRTEGLHRVIFGDCDLLIQHEIGHLVTSPKMFKLMPDIVIKAENEHYIIDTKYKLLDPSDRKLGVAQQDLYQMYVYCKALEAKEAKKVKKVKKVLLLYPEELNEKIEGKLTLRDEIDVYIRTIPLSEDLGSNWNKFVGDLCRALSAMVEE